MRRTLSFLFFCTIPFLLLTVASGADLRIATYNINNYLVMDRHVGARWRPSYPKPESEKLIVRQIIQSVAPDILVLQEMGPLDFLEELRSDLERDGVLYNYAVHMRGLDKDRHVAVLSKLPPIDVVKHNDLDFKYFEDRELVKRGLLELSFDLGEGEMFQIFALHLKSRYTDNKQDLDSAQRRVREAEACRNRIIERTYDRGKDNFLIVGDFNDHPVSAPMRRFYRRGDLEIGSLVPAVDSRGELWTYFYEKESSYDAIDGFVASPLMQSHIKVGRAHIVDSAGALMGSDHRMVYLDIEHSALR
jgi:endonuclease/exonuclease/phosphatase family metal-dependent hydrolase